MDVERVEFGPCLMDLEDEWESLAQRSSRPTIYSTFDYVYTSCCHFRNDEEIFFLLFRQKAQGRLLAIFPMSVWRDKVHGVTLRRIEHGTAPAASDADKPYPIIDRDHEEACWMRFSEYFRSEFRQWERIAYHEFWVPSGLNRQLSILFPRPYYWTKTRPGPISPILSFDEGWEGFWNAHQRCRSKNRRLEKALGDGFRFEVATDPADVERCLDAYVKGEQANAKPEHGAIQVEKLPFYQELLPKLARKGRTCCGMLYDHDTLVAAEIAYVFMGTVYFALCMYNADYSRYSPGMVRTSRLIRYFFDQNVKEGDFLAGYSQYMNSWASHTEETVDITIGRFCWRNLYVSARHAAGRLQSRLSAEKTFGACS